jgi:O-antigen ligase
MSTPANTTGTESILDTTLGWLAVVLAFSLPLYRPWVTLASSAILVLWLFGPGVGARARRLRGSGLTMAILAFVGLSVLSLLWTNHLPEGIRYLTKYRYFLLVPMIASSVKPTYRRLAVTAFEIAAAISVVLSFAVFFGLIRIRDAHPGNPSPTMAHLDYGLVLALAALLMLVRVLYVESSSRPRFLWAAAAALTIAGLTINIGRTGHLAFAFGLLVVVVRWAKGRSATLVAGVTAALGLLLLVVWLALPTFRARVDETRAELRDAVVNQDYDSNLGGRLAAMKIAREVFRQDPVLGTGVGGNIPAMRQAIDARNEELRSSIYWYRHYHNQYAQVATELGAVGLLVLGWMFWELIRRRDRRPETDAAALVLATTYVIGFLGEPYFHKQITLILFALIAGFISAEDLESAPSVSSSNEHTPVA